MSFMVQPLLSVLGFYPLTSLPAPIPMAQDEQIAVGCSTVNVRSPVIDEGWALQCHTLLSLENIEPETALSQLGEPLLEWRPAHSEFGMTVHATSVHAHDDTRDFGIGFSQRIWFVEEEPIMVGFQGDLGTWWIHLGVPLVLKPNDWLHVYARPAWHVPLGYILPLGSSIRLGEFVVSGEYRFGQNRDIAKSGDRLIAHRSFGLEVSWRPRGLERIEVR